MSPTRRPLMRWRTTRVSWAPPRASGSTNPSAAQLLELRFEFRNTRVPRRERLRHIVRVYLLRAVLRAVHVTRRHFDQHHALHARLVALGLQSRVQRSIAFPPPDSAPDLDTAP